MPEDSNVVCGESLRAKLYACDSFDREEFEKPFNDVDFAKVAKSVAGVECLQQNDWAIPKKGNGAQASTGIKKYSVGKSQALTIGSGTGFSKSNLLILKNLKTKFVQHSATFSDKSKKQLSLKDVAEMRTEMPPADYRKFVQANVSVEVATESKNM